VHGRVPEIRHKAPGIPGLGVAVVDDVLDLGHRHHLSRTPGATLDDELADARQVARRRAHAAGTARRAEVVDRFQPVALRYSTIGPDVAR